MVGISAVTYDKVTFTITLPVCGIPFEAMTEALNDAAREQANLGNIYAAQALRELYILAERGRVAYMTPPTMPSRLKE
jgi:hypothetical protein